MGYNFYSDPGHGWLRVPHSMLVALGIEDQISRYSYRRNDFAYLEEDIDADTFIKAYEDQHDHKPRITEMPCISVASVIRSYASYYTGE